jgi:hypothetical protein
MKQLSGNITQNLEKLTDKDKIKYQLNIGKNTCQIDEVDIFDT